MKKITGARVLIPGRFQPLHYGHMALVTQATRAGATDVVFGVRCMPMNAKNPLSTLEACDVIGEVFKEVCEPTIDIRMIPNLVEKNWGQRVLKQVGPIDIVYAVNPRLRAAFKGLVPLGNVSRRVKGLSATDLRRLVRDVQCIRKCMLKIAPQGSVDALLRHMLDLA